MTIICKAKELVSELGKEKAIDHFKSELDKMTPPKDFQQVCNSAGIKTAIKYIEDNY